MTTAALLLLALFTAERAFAQAPRSFQGEWAAGTPISMTGVLTVTYQDDLPNHRVTVLHTVRDETTGVTLRLEFEHGAPPHLRSGSVLRVAGRRRGNVVYLAANADGTTTVQPATTPGPATGEQRTLVIVANFSDSCVSCSNEAINDIMFADPGGLSVDAMYRETSQGRLWLSGTVVGPYTIAATSLDPCDYSAWSAAAEAQAGAAGVDVGSYPRKVYVLPPNSCAGSGFGTLGGSQTGAWVFDCRLKGLYAHELGHNFGMNHAATPTSEYGDTTDAMGLSETLLKPMNAPHRQQLGWLPDGSIAPVAQSGLYDVAPLAVDGTGLPRVLTIRKPDTGEYYYLSYRHGIGFDNYIDGSYRERLNVHRYAGDGTAAKTYLLAALLDGENFTDSVNGVSVRLVAHDDNHATVRIDLAAPSCTPAPPVLSVSPLAQNGVAGTTRSFGVSVTNADSAGCAATTYAVTAAAPSGWPATLSTGSLSLAPGTMGSATLTVTAPTAAAQGTYTGDIAAVATPVESASASFSYTVTAPCVAGTPSVVISPSSQAAIPGSTLAFAVTVANTDSMACSPATFVIQPHVPAGWSAVAAPASLSIAPGESRTVTLSATSALTAASGSYALSVSAADSTQPPHVSTGAATYSVLPAPDTTAPSAPSRLSASVNQKLKLIQLSWTASTDKVGVAGYRVLRNGVVVAMVAGTAWSDPAFVSGSSYTYSVVAYDAAGNVSAPSNMVSVTLNGGKKR